MSANQQNDIGPLGWAIQSGKGVAADHPTHRVKLTGGDIVRAVPNTQPDVEFDGNAMRSFSEVMSVEGRGTPQFSVRPSMAASLWYAHLGHKAVTGSGDPYQWAIDSVSGQPLYVTVWSEDGSALFQRFMDCRISQITVTGENTKYLQISPMFVGGVPTGLTAADTAVDPETEDRIRYTDGSAALLLEGTAIRLAARYDLVSNRNITVAPGDSLAPVGTDVGEHLVTLGLQYEPAEMDIIKRLLFGTTSLSGGEAITQTALLATLGSPAGVQFTHTRSASRIFKFAIPKPAVTGITDAIAPTPGPRRRTLNLRAYDPGSGTAPLGITIKNADAAIV